MKVMRIKRTIASKVPNASTTSKSLVSNAKRKGTVNAEYAQHNKVSTWTARRDADLW